MFSFGNKKPFKLGIAFSGGGARGFAHAGAIKAFEEMGLKPDIVAGVSAGSVVCALYAGGLKPEQMVEIFSNQKFSDLCQLSVPKDGFFTMDGFKQLISRNVVYPTIESLPLPTVICATDMDNGKPVAFESGALPERVAASCSIPIIFKPVKIDGVRYIDGGVLHNLPAWAIRDRCKYLIGLNCSSLPKRKYKDTLLDIAQASYNLAVKSNTWSDMELCDLAIDMPEIASYKVFNLKEINHVFRQGYALTKKALLENGFVDPLAAKQKAKK
ncbi:MAG: patatin-like phospholipase family protein [Bacteroidales bacterium]|nr:patatin-like phospholipase family protein [Bacteroidales bacterium]